MLQLNYILTLTQQTQTSLLSLPSPTVIWKQLQATSHSRSIVSGCWGQHWAHHCWAPLQWASEKRNPASSDTIYVSILGLHFIWRQLVPHSHWNKLPTTRWMITFNIFNVPNFMSHTVTELPRVPGHGVWRSWIRYALKWWTCLCPTIPKGDCSITRWSGTRRIVDQLCFHKNHKTIGQCKTYQYH